MGGRRLLQAAESQPSLLGAENWQPDEAPPRRRSKSKLMFVLKPPGAVAARMHEDATRYMESQNGRPAYPAELLHMSLALVAEFDVLPKTLVDRAKAAAERISARPIPITLDSAALFGGTQHMALCPSKGNAMVAQIVRLLGAALKAENLPCRVKSNAMPHVTLVYGCGRIEPMPIERNYAWIAGEFMLVASYVGETRHEELGRWKLDPNAPPYAEAPRQLHLKV